MRLGACLVGVLMLLVSDASSQVVEAQDWIVGRTQHSLMKRVSKLTSLPEDLLPANTAVIAVDLGGAYSTVTVLGPVEADANQLGQVLYKGLGSTRKVSTSQENDFAAAQWISSKGSFRQTTSTQTVALEPIRKALEERGFRTTVAVRIPKHCVIEPSNLVPTDTVRGNSLFLFNPKEPVPALSATVTLDRWYAFFFALTFFIPPLLTGFGLIFGGISAQRSSLPAEQRRAKYARTAQLSLILGMGIPAPFILYGLTSRMLNPIADGWFGTSSVLAVSPYAIAPLLLILPFAFYASRIETNLQPKVIEAKVLSERPRAWVIAKSLAQFLPLPLLVAAHFAQPSKSTGQGVQVLILVAILSTALLPMLVDFLYGRYGSSEPIERDATMLSFPEQDLVDRVDRVAGQLKVSVPSVVVEAVTEPSRLTLIYTEGKLTVPRRALDELPAEELDIAIACAMIVPTVGLGPIILFPPVLMAIAILAVPNSVAPMSVRMLMVMVPSFAFMILARSWLQKRVRARWVRRVLRVVPNPVAAESYLGKLWDEGAFNAPMGLFGGKPVDPWKEYQLQFGRDL